MNEPTGRLNFLTIGDRGRRETAPRTKIGVVDGAVGGPERFASLAALFPQVDFASAGATWPDTRIAKYDILIVQVDAASPTSLEQAALRLKDRSTTSKVVVVLSDADVVTTRRLLREGAADVLPAPVGEPALAVSLERLLHVHAVAHGGAGQLGEVVAFLKAGGGVGATCLAVQTAALLASRDRGQVALVDLDLQFGSGSLYLDMPDAVTLSDVLGSGSPLEETPFETTLPTHRSGVRVLAAPRDITPLEVLSPLQVESLAIGLRRDFSLSIIDLPPVWTAWTNGVLQLADRIVLVSQLSVPHIQLVKRQLRILASQGLDDHPILIVLNGVTGEQQSQVSLKAAERALGRPIDVVVPEDRKTMGAAINEGLLLAGVRRGTKLEKAVGDLADKVAVGHAPSDQRPSR